MLPIRFHVSEFWQDIKRRPLDILAGAVILYLVWIVARHLLG